MTIHSQKLDHEAIALHALYTKFHKDRLLSTHEASLAGIKSSLPSPPLLPSSSNPSESARKVVSRLLSSKILATEIKSVLESLRAVIEPPKTQKADLDEDDSEGSSDDGPAPTKTAKAKLKPAASPALSASSDGEDNDEAMDEDIGDYDGLIASASEDDDGQGGDDDGWESGSVASATESLWRATKKPKRSTIETNSESESESESDEAIDPDLLSEDGSDDDEPSGKSKGTSQFLPSLQVGFTRGDSDASDVEKDDVDVDNDKEVRKNRRGQRARKAYVGPLDTRTSSDLDLCLTASLPSAYSLICSIWEKKYGRNANHVKKEQNEERALGEAKAIAAASRARVRAQRSGVAPLTTQGTTGNEASTGNRAARRAAIPSTIPTRLDGGWKGGAENCNAPRPPPPHPPATGKSIKFGASESVVSKPVDEKLHPSWEAKRKQKDRELQQAAMVASGQGLGKKIKF